MDTIWQMQKAVYTTLNNDATLSGMVTGIFHSVPQNTAFPYINISKSEAENTSNHANTIYKISHEITIFSQGRSNLVLLNVIDKVISLLVDIDDISVTNHQLLDGKMQSTVVNMLEDGLTWKGIVKLEYLLKVS